jgi:hypothetical protein
MDDLFSLFGESREPAYVPAKPLNKRKWYTQPSTTLANLYELRERVVLIIADLEEGSEERQEMEWRLKRLEAQIEEMQGWTIKDTRPDEL